MLDEKIIMFKVNALDKHGEPFTINHRSLREGDTFTGLMSDPKIKEFLESGKIIEVKLASQADGIQILSGTDNAFPDTEKKIKIQKK